MHERVATLIANPSNPVLTSALADDAREAVNGSAVYFLADGIACDIPLREGVDDAEAKLRTLLNGIPVDVAIQNANDRRKSILLADMDSTMIQQECIDELAAAAGIGDHVAGITARAMRGELEFESALRERVGLLTGKPADLIEAVLRERITLTPGGHELVTTMRARGNYCALVSGGFTQFTSKIASMLGFDEDRANVFDIEDDRFTGKVRPPILGRDAKVQALEEIAQQRGLTAADVIAVGDGANDLGMLQRAGSGVALHAKPIVAEQAQLRIDHGDLTALLYLQGYRKSDFVS